MDNSYIVTKDDIEQTFQIMCKYSIHSFIDDIKKGFITLRGGHRVGIVGKTIIEDGQVKNIKHISSLNIRISREVLGCSDKILSHIIKEKIRLIIHYNFSTSMWKNNFNKRYYKKYK